MFDTYINNDISESQLDESYYIIHNYSNGTVTKYINTAIRTYTIKKLDPDTYYSLEIISTNIIGSSVENKRFIFKTS